MNPHCDKYHKEFYCILSPNLLHLAWICVLNLSMAWKWAWKIVRKRTYIDRVMLLYIISLNQICGFSKGLPPMMEMKWRGINELFNRAHLPIGGDHPVRHADRLVLTGCDEVIGPNINECPSFEIASHVEEWNDASCLYQVFLTIVMQVIYHL